MKALVCKKESYKYCKEHDFTWDFISRMKRGHEGNNI